MKKIITAPTTYEDELVQQGMSPIAGIDEAGRGALAGPVVACAVILPAHLVIDGVNDSKKLSAKRRAELACTIKDKALAYEFGIIDAGIIDKINILQAALLAMETAANALNITPRAVLVDGNKLPQNLPGYAKCIKQGDSHSHIIAAASILAKQQRDAIMQELHNTYPQYNFAKHKGYGTAEHRQAIQQHGQSPYHRKSFICKIQNI